MNYFMHQGEKLEVVLQTYSWNDRVAVWINGEDGAPYATLSVNVVDEVELEEGEFVLNHDLNSPHFFKFLENCLNSYFFIDTEKTCDYGFVKDQPIWRINYDKFKMN